MFLSEHQGPVPKTLRIVYRGFRMIYHQNIGLVPLDPSILFIGPKKNRLELDSAGFPAESTHLPRLVVVVHGLGVLGGGANQP
jgi:hypothetical protein